MGRMLWKENGDPTFPVPLLDLNNRHPKQLHQANVLLSKKNIDEKEKDKEVGRVPKVKVLPGKGLNGIIAGAHMEQHSMMNIGTIHASEKLAKVGTNGTVTKGRDKENKIPDTRKGQRTACDALENMFSVLARTSGE